MDLLLGFVIIIIIALLILPLWFFIIIPARKDTFMAAEKQGWLSPRRKLIEKGWPKWVAWFYTLNDHSHLDYIVGTPKMATSQTSGWLTFMLFTTIILTALLIGILQS